MKSFQQIRRLSLAISALVLANTSLAITINSNDITLYNAFATGATLQNFESISGMTPLGLASYANALDSSTAVPVAAQLGLDIPGLLFHSGGGSFNNPTGNPGTPTALLGGLADIVDDIRSGRNFVGSLEINTENLDLDQFIEIVFINTLQARVGVWLNPSLGNVTMTAFDSSGSSLEQVSGTAGNFVGFERSAADIKFVSIVNNNAAGFTIDDLTYAGARSSTPVPEPGTLTLIGLAIAAMALMRRRVS
jgi:PEP-CTERM motif